MQHRIGVGLVLLGCLLLAGGSLAGCAEVDPGEAFGANAVSTVEDPGFLVPSDSPLSVVRDSVTSQLREQMGSEGGYAYLSYHLPDGFHPAASWGTEDNEAPNPITSGRFYAAAFTDGSTVIRLAINPDQAPSALDWTLPPGGLDWKRTGAGCMLRDVYEGLKGGIDYFRVKMPDDEIMIYGPQESRAQIWEVAEGLAPVVVGGGKEVPATIPGDFQILLKYGVGSKNVLDTAAGTFTRDMVVDPSITIPLTLTTEEMSEIYRRLRDIDFWAYPTRLQGLGEDTMVTPSSGYSLLVHGKGIEHSVAGNDWEYGRDLGVVALWKLVERVQQMIEAKDEYKSLPKPRGGYALLQPLPDI